MKHSLRTSQRENIAEQIRSYLYRESEAIIVAYMFGSFVTADSFADIDLGILMDSLVHNTMNSELDLECKLEEMIKFPVDVRIINGAPLSFCQNIIRHGRVIVDKDPDFRAEFEGNIVKQYSDFSHFRRRYLDEIRNAPV
jgi:predicted nucleotidyltransferase